MHKISFNLTFNNCSQDLAAYDAVTPRWIDSRVSSSMLLTFQARRHRQLLSLHSSCNYVDLSVGRFDRV